MATVTKSIGTSGRDYSTIQAWEDDLDNGAIYASGDVAVGECYNDSIFTAGATIDGGTTIGLSNIVLTAAAGQRHLGTAGTGVTIQAAGLYVLDCTHDLDTTISWLELDGLQTPVNSAAAIRVRVRRKTVANCLVYGFYNNLGSFGNGIILSSNFGTFTPSAIINNIVYDIFGNQRPAVGIHWAIASSRAWESYNNTVYNITGDSNGNEYVNGIRGTANSSTVSANNLVCDVINLGAGTQECFSLGSATVSYNAASDATATGTGSITNIVTADQFVSTVAGSEDLHLKAGSDCISAGTDLGTTPTGVNIDIDGFDRDAEGVIWDIGADQYVAAGGGQIKVWDGSSWVVKPVKVWDGSAWQIKPVKYWSGSAWVTTTY